MPLQVASSTLRVRRTVISFRLPSIASKSALSSRNSRGSARTAIDWNASANTFVPCKNMIFDGKFCEIRDKRSEEFRRQSICGIGAKPTSRNERRRTPPIFFRAPLFIRSCGGGGLTPESGQPPNTSTRMWRWEIRSHMPSKRGSSALRRISSCEKLQGRRASSTKVAPRGSSCTFGCSKLTQTRSRHKWLSSTTWKCWRQL